MTVSEAYHMLRCQGQQASATSLTASPLAAQACTDNHIKCPKHHAMLSLPQGPPCDELKAML